MGTYLAIGTLTTIVALGIASGTTMAGGPAMTSLVGTVVALLLGAAGPLTATCDFRRRDVHH